MQDVRAYLTNQLSRRILVLDGAMGTMIQAAGPTEADFRGDLLRDHAHDLKGNNDLLCLTRPDLIRQIHHDYFAAGCDIATTNTFNGTAISQGDYGLAHLTYDINVAAARLAREEADRWTGRTPDQRRLVAGSIPPTNRTASLSPDVERPGFRNISFQELATAYTEQVRGLLDGGAHLLLVETIFDTLNAKAALWAIQHVRADAASACRCGSRAPSPTRADAPSAARPPRPSGSPSATPTPWPWA